MPKRVLHNVKVVLGLRPEAGLNMLDPLQLLGPTVRRQRAAFASAQGHGPVTRSADVFVALVDVLAARVGGDTLGVVVLERRQVWARPRHCIDPRQGIAASRLPPLAHVLGKASLHRRFSYAQAPRVIVSIRSRRAHLSRPRRGTDQRFPWGHKNRFRVNVRRVIERLLTFILLKSLASHKRYHENISHCS